MSNNFVVKNGLEVTNGITVFAGGITVTGTAILDELSLTTPLPASSGGSGTLTTTGTGDNVLNTSPTLVTPELGSATATSLNKITVTPPATSATLALDEGSSLITSGSNSITLTSTEATNVTLPVSGTLITDAVTVLSSLYSVDTITTGTWSASFGAVSGANLTNLTAANLEGTIPSTVLGNSSVYIGTTSVALNRETNLLVLTGVSIDGAAGALTSATSSVSVSSATAPTAGQVLSAIDGTSAIWATPVADLTTATGTLPVTNGGTGATTSTGSGSVVLAISPEISTSLTTGSTSFDLLNTTATTLNLAGSASVINVGASTGKTTIKHDLQVEGTITYGGTANQLSATNLSIDDALIYIGSHNPADIIDLGFIGAYNYDGANPHPHTGIVRDASDGVWKIFSGINAEPGNTVDFSDAGAVYDDLRIGKLTTTGVNKVSITAPATSATLTLANNSSFITSGGYSTTLTATAATTLTLPTSGTLISNADSVNIGTTSVALNRASGSLALTGVSIDGYAGALKTATGSVTVSAATAPSNGQVLMASNGTTASWVTPAASGVTSVGLSVPAFLTVANSPVTTSGTLAITLSGSALPVANGGTGATASTGTGNVVLASSPTLSTPVLGVASVTSINKVSITAPATSATLTLANNSSFITSGGYSTTLTATATTALTLPTSGTLISNADSVNIGTTSVALNRASGSLALTGVSIDGYAGALKTATGSVTVSAATAPSINQVLTASSDTAAEWRDISAILGNSSGTVTSVSGQGTVNGITLTGAVATSGYLTLGGTLSGIDLATQVTGTLPVGNGGTGTTTSTGSGKIVFGTSPDITTSLTTPSTIFSLINTTATTVNFAGAATTLGIGGSTGNTTVNNNLVVSGNFTVNGTNNIINTSSVSVVDPIISMASGNTVNTVDIGFFGLHDSSTTSKYTGFVRDASDGNTWKLFDDITALPGTTVDFTTATYAPIKVGAITGTKINNVTITAPGTAATLTLANNSSLITAGSFTTAGAFDVTLTATAATSVTLPTSGTLLSSTSTIFNKVTITAPGTAATLTLANNSTLSTAANFTTTGAYAITLTATGATSVTLPTTGTLVATSTVNGVTGCVQDTGGNLRSIPQVAKTAAYTLIAGDNGKNINITTGGITIPVSVFAAGDVVSIYNQSGTAQNIAWSGPTVYLAGTSTAKTSPLSLSGRGILTIMFVTGGATPEIVVSGNV